MTTQTRYTTQAFMSSPAFVKIAIEDALAVVAKANNQSVELARTAFEMGTPGVVEKVAQLMVKAAQHCADEANAGRLWK